MKLTRRTTYDGRRTTRPVVERYAYLNTRSEAGRGSRFVLAVHEVSYMTVWTNGFGNPTTMIYMADGDTFLCVDDYSAQNGLGSVPVRFVERRKDL